MGSYHFGTKHEFPALGFALGVDDWLNDDWGSNLDLRFVDSDADADHNFPVDPTFENFGVSRRS